MQVLIFVLLTVSSVVLALRDPRCPLQADNDTAIFYPHEADCAQFYTCASNGTLVTVLCAGGLEFDTELNVCNWPNGACNPPGVQRATKVSCAPEQNGLYFSNFENDCRSYFQCADGVAFEYKCAAGLAFNPRTKACDYPSNVKCVAPVETTYSQPDCSEYRDGTVFANYADSCRSFYLCNKGRAVSAVCEGGLGFNPRNEECEIPDWKDCICEGDCIGGIEDIPPVTDKPPITEPPCEDCKPGIIDPFPPCVGADCPKPPVWCPCPKPCPPLCEAPCPDPGVPGPGDPEDEVTPDPGVPGPGDPEDEVTPDPGVPGPGDPEDEVTPDPGVPGPGDPEDEVTPDPGVPGPGDPEDEVTPDPGVPGPGDPEDEVTPDPGVPGPGDPEDEVTPDPGVPGPGDPEDEVTPDPGVPGPGDPEDEVTPDPGVPGPGDPEDEVTPDPGVPGPGDPEDEVTPDPGLPGPGPPHDDDEDPICPPIIYPECPEVEVPICPEDPVCPDDPIHKCWCPCDCPKLTSNRAIDATVDEPEVESLDDILMRLSNRQQFYAQR